MKIQKILLSTLLILAISPRPMVAGDMSPKWMKKYKITSSAPYLGAFWTNKNASGHYTNKVIMSATKMFGVWHGAYRMSGKEHREIIGKLSAHIKQRKIIIKQKNPCYIVPKNWNKRYGKLLGGKGTDKINRHTVAVYQSWASYRYTKLNSTDRRGFLKDMGTPKNITKENSTIILGNSFECLREPNEETWKVYWKLKGKWVLMAEEKFYLN